MEDIGGNRKLLARAKKILPPHSTYRKIRDWMDGFWGPVFPNTDVFAVIISREEQRGEEKNELFEGHTIDSVL